MKEFFDTVDNNTSTFSLEELQQEREVVRKQLLSNNTIQEEFKFRQKLFNLNHAIVLKTLTVN